MNKTSILIIDDEKDLLDVMSMGFEDLNYNVSLSRSVDEAMEFLNNESFDYLLTDLNLNKESGGELAK